MEYFFLVFLASILVDIVPFVGPPAWAVMVFLQVKFGLDIWGVLIAGVTGSTVGRYLYSLYIPLISEKFISNEKSEDIRFIGDRLGHNGWKVQAFVLFYTLVPLPSTPLFTAAGMARIRAVYLLPAFFVGKFLSDMVMVLTGNYAARNAQVLSQGLFSWKSLIGTALGILILVFFLFIDWRTLIMKKRLKVKFNIWKK